MDFQKKNPVFADKTSYFQFGTLKYIDVFASCFMMLSINSYLPGLSNRLSLH